MIALRPKAFVYEGVVSHRRFKPMAHSLRYRVFSFLLDLDALNETAMNLHFFSRGRFNLFSFYDCDYGSGRPKDLAQYIRRALRDAGVKGEGKILLLCYPRMLGYAFNPLSVYYCYDANDRLTAMIYEVHNTFGDRHSYLIPVVRGENRIEQAADKSFHVSPFIDMNIRYHFSLSHPDENVSVSIQTVDAEGPVLNATFSGACAQLTDKKLLSLFFCFPLMTLKVVAGIHWEALKLLAKGLRLRPGAPTPEKPITIVSLGADNAGKAA